MNKGSFLNMLGDVLPDRSFLHVNQHGLCNWVFKSMPAESHNFDDGLCLWQITPGTNNMYEILCHFEPTQEDKEELAKDVKSDIYWGSDSMDARNGHLTELRETILLFCAAINKEL